MTGAKGGTGDVGAVHRHAVEILQTAQVYADRLRAETAAEASIQATELTELRRVQQEAHDVVAASRRDAEHDRSAAATTLATARADATQALADAADQAAVVSSTVERTAAVAVADARDEAARLVAEASTRAEAMGAEATRGVGQERAAHDAELAELMRSTHEGLDTARAEANEAVRTGHRTAQERVASADADADRIRSEAAAEHDRLLRAATEVLADHQRRAEEVLAAATSHRDLTLASAHAEAVAILTEAQDHLTWAKGAVAGLLDGAQGEADASRRRSADELAAHTRQVRTRLSLILARATHRVRQELAQAHAEADEISLRALALVRVADTDAATTRNGADVEATNILERARSQAAEQVSRAEQRLTDAADGARLVRQRAATDLERLQRETYGETARVRAEAVQLLDDARSESQQLREEAAGVLAAARDEVARLRARRDAIASELADLAGVIEALSVPEHADPSPRGAMNV